MTRKEYMKPSMKVIELQHKCKILAGNSADIRDANYEFYAGFGEDDVDEGN
jgi:hypothetical protein